MNMTSVCKTSFRNAPIASPVAGLGCGMADAASGDVSMPQPATVWAQRSPIPSSPPQASKQSK